MTMTPAIMLGIFGIILIGFFAGFAVGYAVGKPHRDPKGRFTR